jgi:uncharacterized protein YajQ (UPF0234 family)
MPSFDAVSRVDEQELDNAYNQVLKEIQTRYDLKNSKSTIEFDKKTLTLTLLADDKMKLQAITEILSQKLAKRGIGLKSLDYKEIENASGGALRQKVVVKQGVSTEDAREIVKLVKDLGLKKVSAQIQQDQVRVNGPKRDDLQEVIQHLRVNAKIELQFVNFKD